VLQKRSGLLDPRAQSLEPVPLQEVQEMLAGSGFSGFLEGAMDW